jgi:hypothetical protein
VVVAVGLEEGWRRCSKVRPTTDVTAVLRRHIAVAQLDVRMRTRPLSGQRWRTRTTAGDGGSGMGRSSEEEQVNLASIEEGIRATVNVGAHGKA